MHLSVLYHKLISLELVHWYNYSLLILWMLHAKWTQKNDAPIRFLRISILWEYLILQVEILRAIERCNVTCSTLWWCWWYSGLQGEHIPKVACSTYAPSIILKCIEFCDKSLHNLIWLDVRNKMFLAYQITRVILQNRLIICMQLSSLLWQTIFNVKSELRKSEFINLISQKYKNKLFLICHFIIN